MRWRLSVTLIFFANFINFLHQPLGFGEGNDYFLVVQNVFETEGATVAVFEPFLRRLVTADIKFPGNMRHTVKVLRVVNPNTASGFFQRLKFPNPNFWWSFCGLRCCRRRWGSW